MAFLLRPVKPPLAFCYIDTNNYHIFSSHLSSYSSYNLAIFSQSKQHLTMDGIKQPQTEGDTEIDEFVGIPEGDGEISWADNRTISELVASRSEEEQHFLHNANTSFAQLRPANIVTEELMTKALQWLVDTDPAFDYHRSFVDTYESLRPRHDEEIARLFQQASHTEIKNETKQCYQMSMENLPHDATAGWTVGFNNYDAFRRQDKGIALLLGVTLDKDLKLCTLRFHNRSGMLMLVSETNDVCVECLAEDGDYQALGKGEAFVLHGYPLNRVRFHQKYEYNLVFTVEGEGEAKDPVTAQRNQLLGHVPSTSMTFPPQARRITLGNVIVTGDIKYEDGRMLLHGIASFTGDLVLLERIVITPGIDRQEILENVQKDLCTTSASFAYR